MLYIECTYIVRFKVADYHARMPHRSIHQSYQTISFDVKKKIIYVNVVMFRGQQITVKGQQRSSEDTSYVILLKCIVYLPARILREHAKFRYILHNTEDVSILSKNRTGVVHCTLYTVQCDMYTVHRVL